MEWMQSLLLPCIELWCPISSVICEYFNRFCGSTFLIPFDGRWLQMLSNVRGCPRTCMWRSCHATNIAPLFRQLQSPPVTPLHPQTWSISPITRPLHLSDWLSSYFFYLFLFSPPDLLSASASSVPNDLAQIIFVLCFIPQYINSCISILVL